MSFRIKIISDFNLYIPFPCSLYLIILALFSYRIEGILLQIWKGLYFNDLFLLRFPVFLWVLLPFLWVGIKIYTCPTGQSVVSVKIHTTLLVTDPHQVKTSSDNFLPAQIVIFGVSVLSNLLGVPPGCIARCPCHCSRWNSNGNSRRGPSNPPWQPH